MDLRNVEKKIREAEFFLERMREVEKRMTPTREPFDFQLSAFLGAARSVESNLRQDHESLYDPWRRKWHWTNGPADDLLRFFADDRNVIVHEGAPKDDPGVEGGVTTTVAGPPILSLAGAGRDYFFKIDGAAHKVTDACAEYVKVLKKLVAQFKTDHS